jgi:hypothetical protein
MIVVSTRRRVIAWLACSVPTWAVVILPRLARRQVTR